jgi:hypothetical protein
VELCKAYFSEGSKAHADRQREVIEEIMILGSLCGEDAILSALEEIYQEKDRADSLVFAFYTISKLTELTKPQEEQIGTRYRMILKGLDHPDPRVRLAAAETLVTIEPDMKFQSSERVIPILASAFNTSQQGYQVLIVAPEQAYVNRLKGYCREGGHEVFDSLLWEEGLKMAQRMPAPDVIILGEEYEELFGFLRADYRSKFSSIIVLVDEANLLRAKDKYREKALVADRELTSGALLAAIDELVGAANPPDRLSLKSNAVRAADALLSINSRTSPFNVALMREELKAAILQVRPEEIKMKALSILTGVATPADVPALLELLTADDVSVGLKVEACNVLGAVLSGMKDRPSQEVMDVLASLLATDDNTLRMAAARAFAEGSFDLRSRFDMLKKVDTESATGEGMTRTWEVMSEEEAEVEEGF